MSPRCPCPQGSTCRCPAALAAPTTTTIPQADYPQFFNGVYPYYAQPQNGPEQAFFIQHRASGPREGSGGFRHFALLAGMLYPLHNRGYLLTPHSLRHSNIQFSTESHRMFSQFRLRQYPVSACSHRARKHAHCGGCNDAQLIGPYYCFLG